MSEKVTYSSFKNGYIYEIPFDMIDRIEYCPMANSRGETVTSAAKRIKWNGRSPDIISNCEFFNMRTYEPSSAIVDEGKAHLLTEYFGFAFKDHKTPIFCYKNNVGAEDYVGIYPVLIRNGSKAWTKDPAGTSGNRARTAIGVKDGMFAIAFVPEQSDSKDATLTDMYNLFKSKGYTDVGGLDGGGSTSYQTNEFSYEQGRKVRGFICIWYKGGTGNKASKKGASSSSSLTSTSSSTYPYKPMTQDKTYAAGKTLYVSCKKTSSLNVRNANYKVIKTLKRNDAVDWFGYKTGDSAWYYVRCADGTCGYVSSQYLSFNKV